MTAIDESQWCRAVQLLSVRTWAAWGSEVPLRARYAALDAAFSADGPLDDVVETVAARLATALVGAPGRSWGVGPRCCRRIGA